MELKIRQASCSNLSSMEGKCFSLLASSVMEPVKPGLFV